MEYLADLYKRHYLLKDHLGSVDTITNEQGLVTKRLSFNAWGERRNQGWLSNNADMSGLPTTHGFTGHEMLDSSDLIHMNGRVYDPTVGRFLSADLFIQAPTNTQSYNRYSYVFNNPLSYTDPSGYTASCPGYLINGVWSGPSAKECNEAVEHDNVKHNGKVMSSEIWEVQCFSFKSTSKVYGFETNNVRIDKTLFTELK